MFGFGKKITLSDDEAKAFVRVACELSGAICQEREDIDAVRVGAIEFCEANLPAYGLPLMMNLQGTIDFISIVEGVPRSSVVKSNRTFATGEKVFPGRMQELGVKGGAKLWGHNVAYCTAFVAAAELAKPLHKEFGRQAFLNSAPV